MLFIPGAGESFGTKTLGGFNEVHALPAVGAGDVKAVVGLSFAPAAVVACVVAIATTTTQLKPLFVPVGQTQLNPEGEFTQVLP